MTDITNTKITRKTESYGNDYKAMKTEAMILQKKGAPFMMASVVIWTLVTIVRMLPVDIMTKNLYTFYCPGMLLPCVLIFSKIIGAHVFKNRNNPFNKLGFINTANQMLYLLIVMWAFNQKPDAMLMLFAMFVPVEILMFYWMKIFTGSGFTAFWIAFVAIVVVCYLTALLIDVLIMKKRAGEYTKKLLEYNAKKTA